MKLQTIVEPVANQIEKEVSDTITGFIRSKICEKIIVPDLYTEQYFKTLEILYKMDKEKFMKSEQASYGKNTHTLSNGTNYWITKKDLLINVVVNAIDARVNGDTIPFTQIIQLSLYGKKRTEFHKWYTKKVSDVSTNKNNISIFSNWGDPFYSKASTFEDVVLSKENKYKLIEGLYNWKHNRDYYSKHNLVHKLGILLYGKPGTGKTSLIKAIASQFKSPVIMFDMLNCTDCNYPNRLDYVKKLSDSPLIVVMEDVDFFFKKRDDDKITKDGMQENQHRAFQILDGLYSINDVIFIATTNHIERLDPGFVRPGRFDIQLELDYFSEEDALSYWLHMGRNEEEFHQMNFEFPIQPALLQGIILNQKINGKSSRDLCF